MAEDGHNVFVTGQGGTGKSFLVKEIFKSLSRRGVRTAIICSSGISGTVYKELGTPVTTVHAFYGLKTADLPWNLVVERATSQNLVRERIKNTECIIWDEASMSSRRILEIVSYIHHVLAEDKTQSAKPFGGKQLIVVGEFLQLPPVPNLFDDGRPMFESSLWRKVLPHRYELVSIMRQDKSERRFLECLQEIRLGQCSEDSETFLKDLSRSLPMESQATHVFFKKLSVLFHNSNILRSLPGEFTKLDAIDEGDTAGIQCPAEKVIMLKPGCKVMLLWNVSEKLRNGTSGIFVELKGREVVVEFAEVGKVSLKRETWAKRVISGNIVGSRKQFPVAAMYAITCHKSQGLTLPAVVLHASKEFVPGLSYVACTRVESCNNLQILGFSKSQLLEPSEDSLNVCDGHCEPGNNTSCCRGHCLSEADFTVHDTDCLHSDGSEWFDGTEVNVELERISKSFFERGEPEDQVIDLETVFAFLCEEGNNSILKYPPPDFDLRAIMREMKLEEPLSQFAKDTNEELEKLINLNNETQLMGEVLWCRAAQIVIEEPICNQDEIKINSKQWANDTRELYLLITRSPSFLRDLQLFYDTPTLTPIQTTIGADLFFNVYKKVVDATAALVVSKEATSPVDFNVKDMPVEGLAKVRHVGAWAIKQVVAQRAKFAKENMFSVNQKPYQCAKESHEMCELFDEHIIENVSNLQSHSKYPGTLAVTEERQFRGRGLTHISDQAYEFFLEAETLRVKLLNESKLRYLKEDTIDSAMSAFIKSSALTSKWLLCFPPLVVQTKKVTHVD